VKKSLMVFMFFVAIAWFGHTFSKNFIVDPAFTKFLAHKGSFHLLQNKLWFWFLRAHIFLSLLALISGPIAFLKSTRKKNKALHRLIGKIYMVAIFLNCIPALYVSFYATGGWSSTIAFILLNGAWISTTYIAYKEVRARKIQKHKEWMVRSYSITLANTTIYVLTLIFHNGLGLGYILSYQIAVWSSWMLNLCIAQGIIAIFNKKDENVNF